MNVFTHGDGTVAVYRNGVLQGTVPGDWNGERYTFAIGDKFKAVATPLPDYVFLKFCNGETPPYCIPQSSFEWDINIEYGEVHAYFAPSAEKLVKDERKQREAADQGILDKLASQGKAVDQQIMSVLASIQDVGKKIAGVDAAWRAGIAGLEGRITGMIDSAIKAALAPVTASIEALKAWITDQVFELLLKKLTGAK